MVSMMVDLMALGSALVAASMLSSTMIALGPNFTVVYLVVFVHITL